MASYSFLDVQATITGPGGTFPLGAGAGTAEEGITIEMADDKDTMTMGSDGNGQHNLHAGQSGTITIRLLKTSSTNNKLSVMYNFQTTSSHYTDRIQLLLLTTFLAMFLPRCSVPSAVIQQLPMRKMDQ
jgi:hypothetical protein